MAFRRTGIVFTTHLPIFVVIWSVVYCRIDAIFLNRLASATLFPAEAKPMLVTMQNSELVEKLMKLARGDIDLVRFAIRESARGAATADLERVVDYIVAHRASLTRGKQRASVSA